MATANRGAQQTEFAALIPVVVLNNAPASVVTPPVPGTEGRKAGSCCGQD
jgi:hypothetical protein